MRFKKPRLGPQLLQAATDSAFFDQTHVLIGGTGAVGGAAALHLVRLFTDAALSRSEPPRPAPRLLVTGGTKQELRQFTSRLVHLHRRDYGREPERLPGIGYRTEGGLVVELRLFRVDLVLPLIRDFAILPEEARQAGAIEVLKAAGCPQDLPADERTARVAGFVAEQIGRPFSGLLEGYLRERAVTGRPSRLRSVILGIPLASLLAGQAAVDLEVAGALLETDLKLACLKGVGRDLARVAGSLADEVLVAHTTAVGGMYDESEDGTRAIRLGFAHSAHGRELIQKQRFAEALTRFYAEHGVKMLITAAAIGIDSIQARRTPPMDRGVWRSLKEAERRGTPAIPAKDLENRSVRIYRPVDVDLLQGPQEPVAFQHGTPLVMDHVIRSGENGLFSVSNADALYRVMRVTTSGELGLLLARTALFGDDPACPSFPNNVCYYTETDNSRQVMDLLAHPDLRRDQLSGLQPKALQNLGSARHQAELHLLGLLTLLQRLRTLDLEALPRQADPRTFDAREYFESRSGPLTLDHTRNWKVEELSADLHRLVTAQEVPDLDSLKHLPFQPDPARSKAAHQVLQEVLRAVRAVPSLGTPILYESDGRRRVLAGPYAAPLDLAVTHGDSLAVALVDRFQQLGGGDQEAFERFLEYHVANGFADLRPVAVLVTAHTPEEALRGGVQVFRDEDAFLNALSRLEPGTPYSATGLLALLLRLRALARQAGDLELELGDANEYRSHFPRDDQGRPLLLPGLVEALRMVAEGLEKNTGYERLDGPWACGLNTSPTSSKQTGTLATTEAPPVPKIA